MNDIILGVIGYVDSLDAVHSKSFTFEADALGSDLCHEDLWPFSQGTRWRWWMHEPSLIAQSDGEESHLTDEHLDKISRHLQRTYNIEI